MSRRLRQYLVPRAWGLFYFSVSAIVVLVWLAIFAPRHPPETVGFVELRPPAPTGHPSNWLVRLNLPPDYRAQPTRHHERVEAGVANARGERQFYVKVRLVSVARDADGDTLLQTFARQQTGTVGADQINGSAEFRTGSRGPIWVQRSVETFQQSDPPRAITTGNSNKRTDRLDVLRYGEEWNGLMLEIEFFVRVGGGDEMEPLLWRIVNEMKLSVS